uniref:Solute carrier family 9 member A9 n=1 Tax=Amphiprion percula TaxID=161767 RepID=A0A3P8TGP8_AMPPE
MSQFVSEKFDLGLKMSASVKHKQDDTALLVLAALSLALLTMLSVWKFKQFKYRLLNETGAAMFYGNRHSTTLPGGTSHPVNGVLLLPTEPCHSPTQRLCLLQETFDPEVLFNLFLPPIIFHGAYTLNQKRFIENLGSVLTYAFLGTIISCMCIGACMYGFTRLMVLLGQAADGEFFLTDCLLFGAIMSATDPVSVLGLLSELRVDLDLHTLLFGESVLNDAVAIVLTHAIATYSQAGAGHIFDPAAFLRSVGLFLGVLVGSFFIGFIFTVITALISFHPPYLYLFFFLLSWSSFLSAEAAGLSGIVAVLFCGLSQARYTVLNLSPEGRTRTKQLFEVFNFLGEIFIFGYMGYVLLTFPHHVFKALFISGAFLSIFISRACNIYPLSYLLNLGRTNKIPRNFQHFMMLAGLRGVVAFSLAARDTSTEVRRTILTTTLLLVGVTTWVLGSVSDPVLRHLDIRLALTPRTSQTYRPVSPSVDPCHLWFFLVPRLIDGTDGARNSATLQRVAEVEIERSCRYLKPLLTHCGPPLTDSLPQCCGVFARVFSSPHVKEVRLFLGVQEQPVELEPEDSNLDSIKAENHLASTGGDSGSEHQEDLVEGDLGLGTAPAHIREA